MALTTFGAIMGFAAAMFGRGEGSLTGAVEKAKGHALLDLLQDLLADQRKNRTLMENARREHVTEMILEPITGLQQERYELDPALPGNPGDADLVRSAIAIQEKEKGFLEDCAAKIPLPEVARIFRKVAKKMEQNLSKLRDLEKTASIS
jgi:hypothetical protein